MDLTGVGLAVLDFSGATLVSSDDMDGPVTAVVTEGLNLQLGKVGLGSLHLAKGFVDLDVDVICRGLIQLVECQFLGLDDVG